ncbi:hypothetical protein RCL1_003467 [Eukaryota sp. TZLM3-RCL]
MTDYLSLMKLEDMVPGNYKGLIVLKILQTMDINETSPGKVLNLVACEPKNEFQKIMLTTWDAKQQEKLLTQNSGQLLGVLTFSVKAANFASAETNSYLQLCIPRGAQVFTNSDNVDELMAKYNIYSLQPGTNSSPPQSQSEGNLDIALKKYFVNLEELINNHMNIMHDKIDAIAFGNILPQSQQIESDHNTDFIEDLEDSGFFTMPIYLERTTQDGDKSMKRLSSSLLRELTGLKKSNVQ